MNKSDKTQKQIGQILIKKGLINANQLSDALKEHQRTKEFLGTVLVKRKQIKEKDLAEALSEKFNIPLISLKNRYLDWRFVSKFSTSLVLDYRCFPLEEDEWSITIAITNPLDVVVLKKAEEETHGFRLKLALVTRDDMDEAIRRYQKHVRGKYI